MPKDAVATLEATREKLIKKLLEKRKSIDIQLNGLGYEDGFIKPAARNTSSL